MFPEFITDDAFRLETRRLWLRWPRVADAAALAKHASVETVSRYTASLPHPYPIKDAEDFVMKTRRGNLSGDQQIFALTPKGKPGAPIGVIGLHAGDAELTIGFWLGEPFQGKGLMAEALDEMLALGFVATDAARIAAQVHEANDRSQNLLESRGFVEGGSLPVEIPLRGGVQICNQLSLARKTWSDSEQKRFRTRRPSAPATPGGTADARGDPARLCA